MIATEDLNKMSTISSLELIGNYNADTLDWSKQTDLRVKGGALIRQDIRLISNALWSVENDLTVSEMTVVHGTLKGNTGPDSVLVGDITLLNGNISGDVCWSGVTIDGDLTVNETTRYYDKSLETEFLGSCLHDNDHTTELCVTDSDTATFKVSNVDVGLLQTNGTLQFGQTIDNSIDTGAFSFIHGGQQTTSYGVSTTVHGNAIICRGDTSMVFGFGITESPNASVNHIEGRNHSIDGSLNHIEGSDADLLSNSNLNTVMAQSGATLVSATLNHVESGLTATSVVGSGGQLNHIEGVAKTSGAYNVLESHSLSGGGSPDLQSISSDYNQSDSGSQSVYMTGYLGSVHLGCRSLTRNQYSSAIGPSTVSCQYAQYVISPGQTDASPFGPYFGSTFTSPASASVGCGHGQISLFHLRGITSPSTSTTINLTLGDSQQYPQMKFINDDSTITNTDVLTQVWNGTVRVLGKSPLSSNVFAQTLKFVSYTTNTDGNVVIADVTKHTALHNFTANVPNVDVTSNASNVLVNVTQTTENMTWTASMETINTGVFDFAGNAVVSDLL